MEPAVYILTNGSRTVLYTGVTSRLDLRIPAHEAGLGSIFTKRYEINRLVYFETFQSMIDAINWEKAVKGKSRAGKIRMIVADNPDWNDLARV